MEWATVAKRFDASKYHTNALPEVRWVVEHIPIKGSVLDVGCLDSDFIQLIRRQVSVLGIDIRPCNKSYVICGDIRTAALGPFDTIVFISTLEHIGLRCYTNPVEELDGDVRALAACHKLLRPGGRVLVTMPYDQTARGRSRNGVLWERRHNYSTAMALAETAGYGVVEYYEDRASELVCMVLKSKEVRYGN